MRFKGDIFSPIIMKCGQNVCLDESLHRFECLIKTMSLGQIIEKPCVRCRGHIFSQILMKLGQNICLHKISDYPENESCSVKN